MKQWHKICIEAVCSPGMLKQAATPFTTGDAAPTLPGPPYRASADMLQHLQPLGGPGTNPVHHKELH